MCFYFEHNTNHEELKDQGVEKKVFIDQHKGDRSCSLK